MTERQHATWGELLQEAVEKPGRMLEAYTAFHNYSFGNALLALEQCTRRNLQPGPLNTYQGWLERKRHFIDDGHLALQIWCKEDAGVPEGQPVRYGIAVTIESETEIPIYDEIHQKLRVRPQL